MRKNQQSLKEVITELLKTYRLQGGLNEVKLINSWEKLMGKMIANHTKEIYIIKTKLFVKLDSAALREELHFAKSKIIKMLNDEVGEKVIEDIVFQ
jgi:predicted nucleic acid-binding Zn ribbon protein